MPALFVLIWSTGFVVARYGMPHAPPLTFLVIRYALSLACLALWIWLARAKWPQSRSQWWHLSVTGLLMHAGYLGGVWAAVKAGISAGTVALIVGLQPMLTALWISLANTSGHVRVTRRQWGGLLLGFAGLVLVVWRKLGVGEVTSWNLALAVFALFSITMGTLYQKRYVQVGDVRTSGFVQIAAALVVSLPLALFEKGPTDWQPELIGAMVWSVLALTLGASSLLILLIQRGAATQVTTLLYLVPPCTALMAWVLFDEALTPLILVGMIITAVGVAFVVKASAAEGSTSRWDGADR